MSRAAETTPEFDQRVANLYQQGKKYREIREAMLPIRYLCNAAIVRIVERVLGATRFVNNADQRSLAIDLIKQKVPYKEIAARCGYRSLKTIERLRRRMGIAPRLRRCGDWLKERIIFHHEKGLSDREIASTIKQPLARVSHCRRVVLGLKPNSKHREACQRAYNCRKKQIGNLAKMRWETKKYDAWMDGAPSGVTPQQWRILKLLIHEGPQATDVVAKSAGCNVGAACALIRKLIRNGHVQVSMVDGRRLLTAATTDQHQIEIKYPAGVPKDGEWKPHRPKR